MSPSMTAQEALTLDVRLCTPGHLMAHVTAESLTIPAYDGIYQVLPGHAPMNMTLAEGDVTIACDTRVQTFEIQGGGVIAIEGPSVLIIADTLTQKNSGTES
jgi:F0F1-type ATP synthase epsilon subunit